MREDTFRKMVVHLLLLRSGFRSLLVRCRPNAPPKLFAQPFPNLVRRRRPETDINKSSFPQTGSGFITNSGRSRTNK